MAAMEKLFSQIDDIISETYSRKNEAELHRDEEFMAALKVQSWFRANEVRAYIKHLHYSATLIQKIWRGYLGRSYYRILVKNSVFIMKLNFYNSLATKIQKVWRGFYTRKYVYNYYSRKRYLEALQIKNEMVRNELAEYAEQQALIKRRQQELDEKRKQEHLARKNHYLVSTEVIPGIYNSPFNLHLSEMEYILRSVKPLQHKKDNAKGYPYDPAWIKYNLPVPPSAQLPRLQKKPQGPFRDPRSVQRQRYKAFQPSLKVETSFLSLENARQDMKAKEWSTRLNDNIFVPFSRREHHYEPLLYTSSQYGHPPYGNNYFREECIDQHIIPQNFKTVVPPIPIFDKMNDTYSQGQV